MYVCVIGKVAGTQGSGIHFFFNFATMSTQVCAYREEYSSRTRSTWAACALLLTNAASATSTAALGGGVEVSTIKIYSRYHYRLLSRFGPDVFCISLYKPGLNLYMGW